VHRAIRHLLTGGIPDDFSYTHVQLASMGEHCSAVERRADEASRDSSDALKCEFMLDKVGMDFSGRIVSVNNFGLFVELEEIYITGLVHITALDRDYFHFDPIGHRLTGERTGKVYRLGDVIEVKVAAVNMDDRKIDFLLAGAEDRKPRQKSGGRGAKRPSGRPARETEKTARNAELVPQAQAEPKEEKTPDVPKKRDEAVLWSVESDPDADGNTVLWRLVEPKAKRSGSSRKRSGKRPARKSSGRSRNRRKPGS